MIVVSGKRSMSPLLPFQLFGPLYIITHFPRLFSLSLHFFFSTLTYCNTASATHLLLFSNSSSQQQGSQASSLTHLLEKRQQVTHPITVALPAASAFLCHLSSWQTFFLTGLGSYLILKAWRD
ncbi:hypothetical protein LINGRAHAP2_LOCUS4734 [Linum grandiflorum]